MRLWAIAEDGFIIKLYGRDFNNEEANCRTAVFSADMFLKNPAVQNTERALFF